MGQKKERILATIIILLVSILLLAIVHLNPWSLGTKLQGLAGAIPKGSMLPSGKTSGGSLSANQQNNPNVLSDQSGNGPSGGGQSDQQDGSGTGGYVGYCGDNICNPLTEDSASCSQDCPSVCGDHSCTRDENPQNCPVDCQTGCGNTICEPNETSANCPIDCGSANEVVVFNQTIDYREIFPELLDKIREKLNALGLGKIPIELVDAGTKNFTLFIEFSERKVRLGTYLSPRPQTTVSILIRNNTSQNYTDMDILVPIPKEAAADADQIQSPNQYTVIQKDPTLEFTVFKMPANGEKTFSYSIPDIILTKEQTQQFPNPLVVNFRPIRPEELPTIGCHSHTECPGAICHEKRCIDQECYSLKQPPGTPCGPGLECTPELACKEKPTTPYSRPASLLEWPSLLLIGLIFMLSAWIIKEYASEN